VLSKSRDGLLKLLDSSETEHWIVTEYFPKGSLEKQISTFRGKPLVALKTFQSLVKTVASLHRDEIVHRDIKPANVFMREDADMVLGDFGIVYLPDDVERIS